MNAVKFLKTYGMDKLLDENKNNLKSIEDYLVRECNLKDKSQVVYAMKLIKKRLIERINKIVTQASCKSNVLRIIKENFKNV